MTTENVNPQEEEVEKQEAKTEEERKQYQAIVSSMSFALEELAEWAESLQSVEKSKEEKVDYIYSGFCRSLYIKAKKSLYDVVILKEELVKKIIEKYFVDELAKSREQAKEYKWSKQYFMDSVSSIFGLFMANLLHVFGWAPEKCKQWSEEYYEKYQEAQMPLSAMLQLADIAGLNLEQKDYRGQASLHRFVEIGDAKMLKNKLSSLEKGTLEDVSKLKDLDGNTALDIARISGSPVVFAEFLNYEVFRKQLESSLTSGFIKKITADPKEFYGAVEVVRQNGKVVVETLIDSDAWKKVMNNDKISDIGKHVLTCIGRLDSPKGKGLSATTVLQSFFDYDNSQGGQVVDYGDNIKKWVNDIVKKSNQLLC